MNTRVCPRCGRTFSGHPAISRKDNKTEICSICGEEEAFNAFAQSYWEEHREEFEQEAELWCDCDEPGQTSYVTNYLGVRHGWICSKCRKFVQIG